MEVFSIGHGARLCGVGIETIRFYEREGLQEEPTRRASGYRQYSEAAVKQIRFIKRAQQLGPHMNLISSHGGFSSHLERRTADQKDAGAFCRQFLRFRHLFVAPSMFLLWLGAQSQAQCCQQKGSHT
ncbi:hypothetical protein KSF_051520 [Reticulibacter mediterranei]|uniref:HTH merR-type domain-containing protein n=1 Tax=Reticulibacter mediterranei TaxID=2778369 RepID=A0A8J3INZ7_9CHLR|nr:MerR family transcriptional regulator [Reticulibacter mediterranei]GHO95104.1 hypothetical protein KSF_051520 [Reticulibacter mediterranei]